MMKMNEAIERLLELVEPGVHTSGAKIGPEDLDAIRLVLGRFHAIAEAGMYLFNGEYRDLQGPLPCPLTNHQLAKLKRLANALKAAGYAWEELC